MDGDAGKICASILRFVPVIQETRENLLETRTY